MEKAGGTARPLHTKSHQPGGPPCWASPLCLRPHCVRQCTFRSLSTVANMGRNNYLSPLLTSSVPLSFLSGEELHSSYRGLIHGRNWEKSLNSIPHCYSQSTVLTDVTPPSPLVWNWFVMLTLDTETSSLRTLKIMPRNLNEIVRSWMRLQYKYWTHNS